MKTGVDAFDVSVYLLERYVPNFLARASDEHLRLFNVEATSFEIFYA